MDSRCNENDHHHHHNTINIARTKSHGQSSTNCLARFLKLGPPESGISAFRPFETVFLFTSPTGLPKNQVLARIAELRQRVAAEVRGLRALAETPAEPAPSCQEEESDEGEEEGEEEEPSAASTTIIPRHSKKTNKPRGTRGKRKTPASKRYDAAAPAGPRPRRI